MQKALEKLSPFELKDRLISLAQEHSRRSAAQMPSPSSAVMVKFSEKWATFFRKAEQHQHPFSENRM
jgi:hypothetical protein